MPRVRVEADPVARADRVGEVPSERSSARIRKNLGQETEAPSKIRHKNEAIMARILIGTLPST